MIQLPGGFRLLVGRDLDERERLYDVVLSAGKWSAAIVVVLGLAVDSSSRGGRRGVWMR